MKKNTSNQMEAIDLFCGIGGLTSGFQKSGIQVIAGLDNDLSCKEVYEKNNNTNFIHADITKFDFNRLKQFYRSDSIKILAGCAPCQPFSSHNFKSKRREQDSRWNLVNDFQRAIECIKPDVISMENVRGFVQTEVFKTFASKIKEIGYHVDYSIIHCSDYGIAQNRSRLVFIACKQKMIKVPEKQYSRDNYLKVKDVIQSMPPLQAGEVDQGDFVHRSRKLSKLNLQRIKQSKPKGTWRDWHPSLLPDCYCKESG